MKKLAFGLLILLVLLVAAVLVVPGQLDWTPYRGRIAQEIGGLTGRAVTIDGPVSFEMLPMPRLVAGDVRVASVPGATVPDLLTANGVDLRVSLLPLLLGRIEVVGVTFDQPSVALETLPDGRRSWDGLGGDIGRRLSSVRAAIRQGSILWLDRRSGRQVEVEAADLRLAAPGRGGPVSISGAGVVAGVPMTLDLALQPRSPLGALPVTATVGLDATDARFGGLLQPDGGLQGDLSVVGKDLDASLARIGVKLPASSSRPGVFALRATVQTRAGAGDAGADRIELTDLTADLGDMRAAGGVAVTLAAVPRVEATLGFNRLALADWAGDDADPAALAGRLAAALSRKAALPVAGTLDLSVAALAVRGGLVRDLRLQATLDPARIGLTRLAFGLPGGASAAASGAIRLDGDRPAADQLSVQLAADDLRGALDWVGIDPGAVPATALRRGRIAGTLTGDIANLRVASLDADLDGNRLTGALTYVGGDRPGIGARLVLSRLDVDAYRPAGAPPLAGLLRSDPALRDRLLAALTGADVNLDATVDAVAVDGAAFTGLRLEATMAQGTLTIHSGRVEGPGGAGLSLNGAIGRLAGFGDIDLQATLDAQDPPALLRALRLHGAVPAPSAGPLEASLRLRGDPASLSVDGTVDALGGTVALGGSLSDAVTAPHAALSLRLTHPDLPGLLQRVGEGGLAAPDLGGVDLYADADWARGRLRLDNLQGTVGPVSLGGTVELDAGGARPRLAVSLRSTALPLDRLLAGLAPSGDAAGQWPARPFDLGGLARVDGNLDLDAAAISLAGWTLDQPELHARLDQAGLTLDRLSAGVAGGRLGLNGRIDWPQGDGQAPRWSGHADLVDADLAAVLRQSAGPQGLAGRLDLGLDATSAGNSVAGLVYGLDGKGLVAVRDATLAGIDLAAAERLLADPGLPGAFLEGLRAAFAGGSTKVPAINATFAIADGTAASTDLRLVTDAAMGTGGFTLDLPRWRLDLGVDVAFRAHPDVPAVGLRFDGTPSAPVRRLETKALEDWAAARAAIRPTEPAPEAPAEPAPSAPPGLPAEPPPGP
ncbi:AsmA family protein [Inquilinus sp. Marseille-Q2685]|uniref:AsmA family protein n=1 Tax=Inquilinus sp. Marseille-Q2685 TaxID=2866581 RepID=UPI001CE4B032|nr:AsmA family protein [Inquilinus sp. Marseille-Q2685]